MTNLNLTAGAHIYVRRERVDVREINNPNLYYFVFIWILLLNLSIITLSWHIDLPYYSIFFFKMIYADMHTLLLYVQCNI